MEQTDRERERMRLLQLYSGMTEEQLEELAADWESLTDSARLALRQEVESRGLYLEFDEAPAPADSGSRGEYITIREFGTAEEGIAVKGLLESAGICARLANTLNIPVELTEIGFGPVRLQVKRGDSESAIEIMDSPPPTDS